MQQDGVDFDPKELISMFRTSDPGIRADACNIVKEMCQKCRGGSISAKAWIQEALSNRLPDKVGVLLLCMFTCAAQACKVVDAKMEVGDDGLTEPAAPIKNALYICEAIGALSSMDIFDEGTSWPLPTATHLCRLASAVCSLWRNCYYLEKKNYTLVYVNLIMNMASTLTHAMIFFETHPKNAAAMAWENRCEIYQIELYDKPFIRSLLCVISSKPRTKFAYVISRVINNGLNVTEFCNR